jgi:transposase
VTSSEAAAKARAAGEGQLSEQAKGAYLCRYERLVKNADKLNPPPPAEEDTGGDSPKKKRPPLTPQRRLVNRLLRRREQVLRFMNDLSVPLDNNGTERDLRMVKLQQKIGGCFRTPDRARDFCRVRSYLSTARKQGYSLLYSLKRALAGKPLPLQNTELAPAT